MRQRWLSRRAVLLHLALAIWFPGCLIAFWWQVHRAFSGNGLSYLYSVEWPVFALTGAWAWWQLVHTDPETVGRRAQERMEAARKERAAHARDASWRGGAPTRGVSAHGGVAQGSADPGSRPLHVVDGGPVRRREDEDAELAAYNDRLARLASEGPKTWRRR